LDVLLLLLGFLRFVSSLFFLPNQIGNAQIAINISILIPVNSIAPLHPFHHLQRKTLQGVTK
jgi:hypothetical protein